MKKTAVVLSVVAAMSMSCVAQAMAETPDWLHGIDVGVQTGIATDSGAASVGLSLGYGGVSATGYVGGHRSDGRRSGYGGDIRVDFSEFLSLVSPYGYLLVEPPTNYGLEWFVGFYGEVGGYYERSGKSCRSLASGNSCSIIDGSGEVAGGGGIYMRVPFSWLDPSIAGLRLGLGYHTSKGATTSLGVYW